MMKTTILLAVLLLSVSVAAQIKETPLLKIGDNVIPKEEFEYIYAKNNSAAQLPISKKEYLELFVNYKLKVAEGKGMGIDTTKQYENESSYYFDELSRPYFEDTLAQKNAINALKLRLKEEVDASHVLVRVPDAATPSDTLEAYRKLDAARKEILGGADFEVVAKRVSEDPSAQQNAGRLGYFTAMQMVEEFEEAAFNTKPGELSEIFRTKYGYHFLKVHDRRPFPGEVLTAHIMKAFPKGCTQKDEELLKEKIDSIYELVKAGGDFAELAERYSDDKPSGSRGGQMPWLTMSRLNQGVMEYGRQAFALEKPGDVSSVFKTSIGWHILKLIDKRTEHPEADLDKMIESAMRRGHRVGIAGYEAKAKSLMREYGFKWNAKVQNEVTAIMMSVETDSVKAKRLEAIKEPLATYSKKKKLMANDKLVGMYWNGNETPFKNYMSIAQGVVMDYEKSRLMDKYADFRYTMREYYDGLIVFEVNKKKIWSHKDIDSIELKTLYNQNLPRYSKDGKFVGSIYFCDDEETAKSVEKLVKTDPDKAEKMAYKVEKGERQKGGVYDDYIWPLVKSKYVVVEGIRTDGEPVPFGQIKGQLISDYQQLEEQKWVGELRDKYKPKIIGKVR